MLKNTNFISSLTKDKFLFNSFSKSRSKTIHNSNNFSINRSLKNSNYSANSNNRYSIKVFDVKNMSVISPKSQFPFKKIKVISSKSSRSSKKKTKEKNNPDFISKTFQKTSRTERRCPSHDRKKYNNEIHKNENNKLIFSEDRVPVCNIDTSDSCLMLSKHNSLKFHTKNKNSGTTNQNITKKSSYSTFINNTNNNNNIAKTNDHTSNISSCENETESNFLNYELGNANNFTKIPEVSLHQNIPSNDKVDECEIDLKKMYKNFRQLRVVNSFDSNVEQSIYYVHTNEMDNNESIQPVYIEKYNTNNKWYYQQIRNFGKRKDKLKMNTFTQY